MPARKQKAPPEINGNLQHAMMLLLQAQASLVQNQTSLVQNQASFMSAFIAALSRIDERFDKVERLLAEHHEILIGLPEAVREKIGFKARG